MALNFIIAAKDFKHPWKNYLQEKGNSFPYSRFIEIEF